MKKIAIQGHITRGSDVIKILKSLGGINEMNLKGTQPEVYYYLKDNYIRCKPYSVIMDEYNCYTLEEYEQKINNMENKRTIQIDLATAREWYNQGGQLREIALQVFSKKELQPLPKSWEEYCEINPYLVRDKEVIFRASGNMSDISYTDLRREEYPGAIPSEKRAQQFLTLNKLLQIRDYYNQGWEPNWDEEMENKYVIMGDRDELITCVFSYTMCLFSFKTRELRDEFLTNFKKDLEFIKEFL